jgi:hypothetical protein
MLDAGRKVVAISISPRLQMPHASFTETLSFSDDRFEAFFLEIEDSIGSSFWEEA